MFSECLGAFGDFKFMALNGTLGVPSMHFSEGCHYSMFSPADVGEWYLASRTAAIYLCSQHPDWWLLYGDIICSAAVGKW